MFIRIALYVLAALLLAAHYFRAGNFWLVAVCLLVPSMFLYRSRWSLLLLQLAAYCATASWLGATLALIQERQQTGRSWTVAALILGAVTLFTLAAGLLLNGRSIRERYHGQGETT